MVLLVGGFPIDAYNHQAVRETRTTRGWTVADNEGTLQHSNRVRQGNSGLNCRLGRYSSSLVLANMQQGASRRGVDGKVKRGS